MKKILYTDMGNVLVGFPLERGEGSSRSATLGGRQCLEAVLTGFERAGITRAHARPHACTRTRPHTPARTPAHARPHTHTPAKGVISPSESDELSR